MKIVFTNGCFDILHAGHVDFLWRARGLGTRLIVGLNSDESVRAVKGPSRPINPVAWRKAVLESLRMVDEVVVFNEPTVVRLLATIRPAIWCKGGDYSLTSLNTAELAMAKYHGIHVCILPTQVPISTTLLLQKGH